MFRCCCDTLRRLTTTRTTRHRTQCMKPSSCTLQRYVLRSPFHFLSSCASSLVLWFPFSVLLVWIRSLVVCLKMSLSAPCKFWPSCKPSSTRCGIRQTTTGTRRVLTRLTSKTPARCVGRTDCIVMNGALIPPCLVVCVA